MAEEKRSRDFVNKIVRDPKNPPKTTLLSGFLGQSSEEGHTRLYLDPELCDYVEIPDGAILHVAESKDDSPVAETLVWIQREAQLIHGEAGGARFKASFLEGRISQDYLASAQADQLDPSLSAFSPPTFYAGCGPTRIPFCPTLIPIHCPSRIIPLCPTRQIFCPTRQTWCPSRIIPLCPTRQVFCRSVYIQCPTQLPRCHYQTVIVRCGPSALVSCQSQAVFCQSAVVVCQITRAQTCQAASAMVQCPTLGACPSAVDGCPSTPGGCGDPTIDPTLTVNPTVFQQGMGYY